MHKGKLTREVNMIRLTLTVAGVVRDQRDQVDSLKWGSFGGI